MKDQVICPFLFKGNLLILLLLKILSEIAQLEDFNNGAYKFGFWIWLCETLGFCFFGNCIAQAGFQLVILLPPSPKHDYKHAITPGFFLVLSSDSFIALICESLVQPWLRSHHLVHNSSSRTDEVHCEAVVSSEITAAAFSVFMWLTS